MHGWFSAEFIFCCFDSLSNLSDCSALSVMIGCLHTEDTHKYVCLVEKDMKSRLNVYSICLGKYHNPVNAHSIYA